MDVATIRTKVAGTTFRLDAVERAYEDFTMGGHELILVREPDNPYDRFAVGVWHRGTDSQIGYIGRHLAPEIAEHMDSGKAATAFIIEFTGGTREKPAVGINIEIFLRDY